MDHERGAVVDSVIGHQGLEQYRRDAWKAWRDGKFDDKQLALIISDLRRGFEIARNADLGRLFTAWFALELSSAESIEHARER
jgi:hypothetical protein